ncbi:hypothetical protein phiAS5_ORF0059 [Aeromonas phage phiAS5]|uniref:Uncharacterized protein n=1 Tax=Aeromonas phage phiAS5 TaxID=879630 RepID=E1A2F6_9CAUD|nr:hypothetical protein phiAS5_ORF0059 [Aeromonas phage phiAS5]ADM79902.1 hypothetical protein phiAS5_ORF0059 [Aeromonas phage phiAS5]BES53328.1 hypothetical protein [Aeromonas phage phiWae14]
MRKWEDLAEGEKVIVKRCVEAILRMGEHQVVFEKVDGTIRVANATLQPKIITEEIGKEGFEKETKPATIRRESFESCRFFEVGSGNWRSFQLQKLISIGTLKIEDLIRI